MLGKLSGVHPYVADRIRYILAVSDWYGGRGQVTSGFRSKEEQGVLVRAGKTNTRPGCSQHNYGLAVDVSYDSAIWQRWFGEAARALGLVTVSTSPTHAQTFPGSDFSAYVQSVGLCSPVNLTHPDGFVRTNPDGSREWVWNTTQ